MLDGFAVNVEWGLVFFLFVVFVLHVTFGDSDVVRVPTVIC